MVTKEMLHLGQEVLVGKEMINGIVDGLTQTFAAVSFGSGGYGFFNYDELSYV